MFASSLNFVHRLRTPFLHQASRSHHFFLSIKLDSIYENRPTMDRSLDEIISERPGDRPVRLPFSFRNKARTDFDAQRGRPRPEERGEPRHEPRRPPPPRQPRREEYPRDGVRKVCTALLRELCQDTMLILSRCLILPEHATSSSPRDPSYDLQHTWAPRHLLRSGRMRPRRIRGRNVIIADLAIILCRTDATTV
jgi:hypothetical protein